jgi:hypothetical protein
MKGAVVLAAALADLVLIAWLTPTASGETFVGQYSGQRGSGRAEIGGSVTEQETAPSSPGTSGGTSSPYSGGSSTSTPVAGQPSVPSGGEAVPFSDPRFRGAQSRAPIDPNPTACLYFPETPGACPVEAPAAAPRGRRRGRAPPIDPAAVAASIAASMPLLPGEITVNPTAAGWTGVPSWFWLEPAPRTVAAVAVLGAERIVVTAQPHPVWRFGDGAITAGSPGRAYRRGAGVAGSVRHEYETRCLPGDAGRNPHVSESCTAAGYVVEAAVEWSISFVATGPVELSGALPSRTTTTSSEYPVSEVRAFLTEGAS